MMDIFELRSDAEQYRWLTLVDESEFRILHDLDGQVVGSSWRPLFVEWIDDELNRGKPYSDFPTLGASHVFSQRAVDAILEVLVTSAELLPLKSSSGTFYLLNVTNVVNALDEENSEIVRFSSGRVMSVDKYRFREHVLRGEVLFKLPQLRGTVFVTDAFVRRVQAAALRGFEFRLVDTM